MSLTGSQFELRTDRHRGCWGAKNPSILLEKLLWKDRHTSLGSRCHWSPPCGRLPRGARRSAFRRGANTTPTVLAANLTNLQRLTGASLLVFLNKSDVEHCMGEEEVREVGPEFSHCRCSCQGWWSQRLGLDSIKTHKWTILPCSAMTGTNLEEGLKWVVQDAKDRLFLYWIIPKGRWSRKLPSMLVPHAHEFNDLMCISWWSDKLRMPRSVQNPMFDSYQHMPLVTSGAISPIRMWLVQSSIRPCRALQVSWEFLFYGKG